MHKLLILAGAVSVLALPTGAVAKNNGRGNHGHSISRHDARNVSSVRHLRADRDNRGEGYRHGCPPGLAKKNNGCLPPGQARRVGQRAPWSRDRYVDYSNLPSSYRDRYADVSGQQYYYQGDRVYAVDARTQLIRGIVNILR